MTFSIIKALTIYSIFLILSSPANASFQPKIQEYYPQCDYTPLDVVTVRQEIKYAKQPIAKKNLADATQFLMTKLLKTASKKNAQAVLIIDREIIERSKRTTSDYYYLSFTAELITPCEPLPGYTKRLTPYNILGEQQQSIELGTIKGLEIQINLDMFANKRQSPIITDRTISASTGFFGYPPRNTLFTSNSRIRYAYFCYAV